MFPFEMPQLYLNAHCNALLLFQIPFSLFGGWGSEKLLKANSKLIMYRICQVPPFVRLCFALLTHPTVFTGVLFCIWDFRVPTVYIKGQPAIHVSVCRADLDMCMHTCWKHACTGLHSKSKTSFEVNRVPCARWKNVAKFFLSYSLGPQSRLQLRTPPRNVSSCDFSLHTCLRGVVLVLNPHFCCLIFRFASLNTNLCLSSSPYCL